MGFPLIPVIAAGAGLIGNALSAREARKGQESANVREMEFNAEQAQLNRTFNAQQAQIDRDFQERLSGTAYQRARKDLEGAGYNPLLALGHPASTPAGAVASGSAASIHPKSTTSESSMIKAAMVKNAMDVVAMSASIDKMKEEAKLVREESRTASAQADMEEQLRDFRTTKYGKFLMGVRETLNTGVSGLLGGMGAAFGGARIARAMRSGGASLRVHPKVYRRRDE